MHRFTIDDHLTIDVRILAGRVSLRPADPGEARVQLEADGSAGRELIERARVELDDASRRPRLVVHAPRERVRGRLSFSLRDPRIHATIWCPPLSDVEARTASADVDADVTLGTATVDTASGNVALSAVDGELAVSTASGRVEVADVTGNAAVKTASGNVRTAAVGGALTVRTASGDVVAGRVGGDLDVRTVSGRVHIDEAGGREMSINSTSGDVELALVPDRGVHLDVATVSGRLSSDLDDDDGTAGVDVDVRARTVSGDVHLRRSRASQAPPR